MHEFKNTVNSNSWKCVKIEPRENKANHRIYGVLYFQGHFFVGLHHIQLRASWTPGFFLGGGGVSSKIGYSPKILPSKIPLFNFMQIMIFNSAPPPMYPTPPPPPRTKKPPGSPATISVFAFYRGRGRKHFWGTWKPFFFLGGGGPLGRPALSNWMEIEWRYFNWNNWSHMTIIHYNVQTHTLFVCVQCTGWLQGISGTVTSILGVCLPQSAWPRHAIHIAPWV